AFAAANQENCTRTVVSSSSTHFEVKYHCDGTKKDDNGTIDGTTTVDISGDSTKGKTHAVSTSSDGHTMTMDMNFTSKYLGPSCGDIK
ncbi:MAG: DUF3617 family protein, partial [Terriglobales bacterium]